MISTFATTEPALEDLVRLVKGCGGNMDISGHALTLLLLQFFIP